MRTLVVGDVHGCASELDDLLGRHHPDRVVLVGDLFTKGPDPVGIWQLIREWSAEAVLGNHDQRLLDALAGNRPDDKRALRCIRALSDTGWADWVGALPLFLEVGAWTVVHAGLHPSGDLALTTRKMAINMRYWPEIRNPRCPHWHAVYTGERKVVFGHDAARGAVRVERHGEPWLIGLDTGCVYGGRLSGWIIEEERGVSVGAARVYRPVT